RLEQHEGTGTELRRESSVHLERLEGSAEHVKQQNCSAQTAAATDGTLAETEAGMV
ncbi:hypothetical protein A2U01_0041403, partial [Trifolium medium]|nr:hypothetical protein [Trifolium medium]